VVSETETLTDFLGNPLAIGDTVVYASTQGRSAKLTKGVIVGSARGGVKVKRTEVSSYGIRGKVGTRTAYIDSRTGKGIDPSFEKHQERGYGYVHKRTGEFVNNISTKQYTNFDEVQAWHKANPHSGYYYSSPRAPEYRENPDFVKADWEFVRPIYKDYVTEVQKEAPPVTVGTGSMLKVPSD
jgi:hypothetical protein